MENTVHSGETTKQAGPVQAWVLIATSWLSVAAAQVIAPVLPKMAAQLGSDPQIGKLIPLIATLPALFVALLAAPAGILADKVGYKRVLLVALAIYGVSGIAPAMMHSLRSIMLTRAAVGIGEAAIMTCGTALLGAYFAHEDRAKWLAYQTGSSNVIAVVFVLGAGLLGEGTWRTPFWIYTIGLVLAVLVALTVWEPRSDTKRPSESSDGVQEPKFQPGLLLAICALTIFASTAFFVMIIQQGFLLTERGYSSTRLIGMSAGIIALAVPVGSFLFHVLPLRRNYMLALSFALSAVGFAIVSFSRGYAMFVVGGVINAAGSGIILPALITWALAKHSARVRGFGTGMWQSSFFMGAFLSPLLMLGLSSLAGGLSGAVRLCAVFCAIAAAACVATAWVSDSRHSTAA